MRSLSLPHRRRGFTPAYKNAAMVRRQIDDFGLATVVDTVEPIGCIMAGDWEKDTPWRKKREAKKAAALSSQPTP